MLWRMLQMANKKQLEARVAALERKVAELFVTFDRPIQARRRQNVEKARERKLRGPPDILWKPGGKKSKGEKP